MITEAEARTKWCPFVRVREPDHYSGFNDSTIGTAVNRAAPKSRELVNQSLLCVASECMAWRWHEKYTTHAHDDGQDIYPRARDETPTHGWCGLAGSP